MVEFVIVSLLLNLPALLGILAYLLYILGSYLFGLCPIHDKLTKKEQKLRQEKNKIWFYNLGLPSMVYLVICTMLWLFFINSIWIIFLGAFSFVYYLAYHLIYFLLSKITSCKYYPSYWMYLIVFLMSFIELPLAGFFLMLSYI